MGSSQSDLETNRVKSTPVTTTPACSKYHLESESPLLVIRPMYQDMELKCPSGTNASLKTAIIPNIDKTNDENNDKTKDENIDKPNVTTNDKNNKYTNDKSNGENQSLPTAVIKNPTMQNNNNHDYKSPITEETVSEVVSLEEPISVVTSPEKPVSEVVSPDEPVGEVVSPEKPDSEVVTLEEPISEATNPEEPVSKVVSPEKPISPVEYATGSGETILVEPSTYTRNCLWLTPRPASAHKDNFESIPKQVSLKKL